MLVLLDDRIALLHALRNWDIVRYGLSLLHSRNLSNPRGVGLSPLKASQIYLLDIRSFGKTNSRQTCIVIMFDHFSR